jgi:hypothetical protein
MHVNVSIPLVFPGKEYLESKVVSLSYDAFKDGAGVALRMKAIELFEG